jgi:hypothetical protein
VNDLVDSPSRYAEAFRETVLADAHRPEELLEEDLPRMDGRQFPCHSLLLSLVVVHDLDLVGIPISPHKADPPLVVDSNTVLTTPVTTQRFQPIRRRYPQVIEARGGIQHDELAQCRTMEVRRELP